MIGAGSGALLPEAVIEACKHRESGGDPLPPEEVYPGKVMPQLARWPGWAKTVKETLDRLTQAAA